MWQDAFSCPGGGALLRPLWPEERTGTREVRRRLPCQGSISVPILKKGQISIMSWWSMSIAYVSKDKETDRCYAAKHIRIRKPEQKEKVELSWPTDFWEKNKIRFDTFPVPQVVEEINLLKKFSNPHIIRFIEAFENPREVIIIISSSWVSFLEGDPDNGVPGRGGTLWKSCWGGFQPHRVRLLPIYETDLQVSSQFFW